MSAGEPGAEETAALSSLRPGEGFVVAAIKVGREIGRRLADMGLTEGAEGRVVRRGAFGGPMQLRIGGYDLLLRRAEAAGVEVRPTEARDAGGRGWRWRGRRWRRGRRGPGGA